MSFAPRPRFNWQLRTRALRLGERTRIMAIVNLTPDSFSGDGLERQSSETVVASAVAAADSGADLVDLGAESTRPGAAPLSSGAEQERLLPVLEALLRARPAAVVSVDTYHAATARAALAAGAEIVNDVSGLLWDDAMAETVAAARCGLVLMHTRGRPGTWRTQPPLASGDVLPLVLGGLRERLAVAVAGSIERNRMVIDPGFGFGKRGASENLALLGGLGALTGLGFPLLVGVSRKGFLAELTASLQTGKSPAETARLPATTAAHVAAIFGGAHILRVHDVQPAREAAAIADALRTTDERFGEAEATT